MPSHQEMLEAVIEARREYQESVALLMRDFRHHSDRDVQFAARRFEAYNPNDDPLRDLGMGMSAEDFEREWQEALDQAIIRKGGLDAVAEATDAHIAHLIAVRDSSRTSPEGRRAAAIELHKYGIPRRPAALERQPYHADEPGA